MRNGAVESGTSSALLCRNVIASMRFSAAVSRAVASIASSGSMAIV